MSGKKSPSTEPPASGKQQKRQQRQSRLAQALRDNLRRRKGRDGQTEPRPMAGETGNDRNSDPAAGE